MHSLILYCRAGFEGECAAEIQEQAAALGVTGYCRAATGSAYVEFNPYEGQAADLLQRLPFSGLIFARQMFAAQRVDDLPLTDRIGPLLAALGPVTVGEVWVETADTNEAKELQVLCRKLATPLTAELQRRGWLHAADRTLPRLHVLFLDSSTAWIGLSDPANSAPWYMGIPRLKFPAAAPSRSTLKLEEALLTFLTAAEREQRLQPAMRAVDLGAAPGGWTWQLVQRHLRVVAVDNGPLDARLMDSGLVEHRREDGFRYRPARAVDWMVCDMVEQPARIARLVADWLAQGWCRECIFNLKLPMKKRYQEVQHCAALIEARLSAAGLRYSLRFRQLYHDREEVTGYLRALS
ncbi:23S rRNA (cytidine(2498)-2'-O)-methyltransferase RlmM [Sulfurivermis fontis]|jgi:23S rRNA (cytidine2498-2'-O)-methyltransferase|uniref:23S rRNA (cytidine(2498)-2'-O)-methyltransferase RlmM n=1 Tax=Sulfurivermis fontis TaxID=1972068 RepID=UPI000FD9E163|nr:23S rRNA (cytidine(2498)-2'-O)-methyltransferase RlmM [Sulfurivermis fontis]